MLSAAVKAIARLRKAGTPVATVVRACADALGVGVGNLGDVQSLLTEAVAGFVVGEQDDE